MQYDERHGYPFDRGSADAYYRRPYNPHYYKDGTYGAEHVTEKDMTPEEIAAYDAGYYDQIDSGDFKNWD